MKIVRDMKGAPVVRIWMFADQTILPVVSPHILINHLLVDLLVELEVRILHFIYLFIFSQHNLAANGERTTQF